jgi:hypothetical protein
VLFGAVALARPEAVPGVGVEDAARPDYTLTD